MAKNAKKSRISPKINIKIPYLPDYIDLNAGDCFIWNDSLCIKPEETDDQCAVDLENGSIYEDMCGELVMPVDVEIKWTKK